MAGTMGELQAISEGSDLDSLGTVSQKNGICNESYQKEDKVQEALWHEMPKGLPRPRKSVSIDMGQITVCDSTTAQPPWSRCAVSVRNAYKHYGGPGTQPIINNLNMSVKEGHIYSLLGASGCGKTTLLSCVVGLKDLNSGIIQVLGGTPGTKESGVPGKRVGYMPQETALFAEFSIFESLFFYGRLYGMTSDQIEENIIFLIDFLNLPPGSRRIKTLSGGQQRRVSFACSMIHNPELLILDEPTVGVDPLLRQSIWDHLVKLSGGKTTIIITTHYIEEARQSHTIGLMRGGKLLVEESPENLLRKFRCNLLEDIVLQLCLKDSTNCEQTGPFKGKFKANTTHSVGYGSFKKLNEICNEEKKGIDSFDLDMDPSDEGAIKWRRLHRASDVHECHYTPKRFEGLTDKWNRIETLVIKNFLTLIRNILFLGFILLCPALQVIIVCLAIGGDPKGLEFAAVNQELQDNVTCENFLVSECPLNSNYTGLLSCHFLSLIDKEQLNMMLYNNERDAAVDVLGSSVWGILTFPSNFTESFKERAMFGINSEMDSIYGSRMDIQMDFSNKQIGYQISKIFYDAMSAMTRNISLHCGIDPLKMETPLFYNEAVYGAHDLSFREFIAPSVLLGIVFFFPITSSGLNYISEKRVGILDRSLVAGVTVIEFMIAYAIVQFLILLIQSSFAFAFLVWVFGITIKGSFIQAYVMAFLVGTAGISVGFILAAICSQEIQAVLLAMGTFVPNLMLAGMIWPLEGMHVFLQYIAYFLPCTLACETMRSIVSRGVGITHAKVYPGFVSTILWIVVYWVSLILIHRIKSKK